jgi:hypothetical protein
MDSEFGENKLSTTGLSLVIGRRRKEKQFGAVFVLICGLSIVNKFMAQILFRRVSVLTELESIAL